MKAVAAPSLTELQGLADRGVDELGCDGQALAVWERAHGLRITLTAVVDGRGGEAVARSAAEIERAAKAARLHAERPRAWPVPALSQPAPAATHDGFDPGALDEPSFHASRDELTIDIEPGAARIAVASSTGVRAAEQRSQRILRVRGAVHGRRVEVVRAAVGTLDPEPAVDEALALLGAGSGEAAPPSGPVVLGHAAVAFVVDRLRPAFGIDAALCAGPLAGRFGTRIAAAGVNLSDSSRYPGTLPRSFDAEGVPRRPVPLIQDGIAHRAVLDTAAAHGAGGDSTGHATRAGALAPYPEHLVLVGGGAEDVAELAAPVDDGLYVPALGRDGEGRPLTRGAVRIRAGRLMGGVHDLPVQLDPLAVLAAVEALTRDQRVVPLAPHCPGGIGAAVVPALRASTGLSW